MKLLLVCSECSLTLLHRLEALAVGVLDRDGFDGHPPRVVGESGHPVVGPEDHVLGDHDRVAGVGLDGTLAVDGDHQRERVGVVQGRYFLLAQRPVGKRFEWLAHTGRSEQPHVGVSLPIYVLFIL
ncbi:hypothetical protein VNG_0532H [Halobacterium salinarum NRC-1]|uniref:Spurious ORF n=1 Tax=Halobacterium salinarum (strain ATCC 700922 / JCM 11081 / NRC-1) TaxID=64091 RepID=Q9HRV2_HALSA|nr:hypothetical protein VNG_0532H [Halobacterium salinarum NRC-1]DAC77755.1 TPA_inf: spurious ORF [Halobacterium salinarum NRC-1]